MERYFESQYKDLRDQILQMSYAAVENLSRALEGFYSRDPALCERAVRDDAEVDRLEIKIDQACHDLLLQRQPVARDLRFATMSMKINTNLERVGDQAVYIARLGCDLAKLPPLRDYFGLPEFGERVKLALLAAVDCYAQGDVARAREVRTGDQEFNKTHREIIQRLFAYMMENPTMVAQAVELIFLAQSLERVGDYAKNIADDVIYMVEAVDPRHRYTAG